MKSYGIMMREIKEYNMRITTLSSAEKADMGERVPPSEFRDRDVSKHREQWDIRLD
jgi:hypothetical protein